MASIGFTIKWAGRMLFHRARLPRLSKRAQCAARAPRRTRSHYILPGIRIVNETLRKQ